LPKLTCLVFGGWVLSNFNFSSSVEDKISPIA